MDKPDIRPDTKCQQRPDIRSISKCFIVCRSKFRYLMRKVRSQQYSGHGSQIQTASQIHNQLKLEDKILNVVQFHTNCEMYLNCSSPGVRIQISHTLTPWRTVERLTTVRTVQCALRWTDLLPVCSKEKRKKEKLYDKLKCKRSKQKVFFTFRQEL